MMVVKFLFFIVWATIVYLVTGVALSIMWGWFLVPNLGLPQIEVAQAIGISLIVSLLVSGTIKVESEDKDTEDEDEKREKVIKFYLNPFVYTLLVLGVGSIVHQFM